LRFSVIVNRLVSGGRLVPTPTARTPGTVLHLVDDTLHRRDVS
jgi:hypothetical protein